MIEEYSELVYRILSGNPIEILDEDTNTVWNSSLWELSAPRDFGVYSGHRKIGSANIITAFNLLKLKLFNSNLDVLDTFRQCLLHLESNNLIRKNPESVRKTFKTV